MKRRLLYPRGWQNERGAIQRLFLVVANDTVSSPCLSLSSVDTARLLKELYARKKGKAYNILSLIIRAKLEIL